MDISEKKIELIHLLLLEQEESVLNEIKAILEEGALSESQKEAIDEALSELKNQQPQPHNSVMEETKTRYPKYFGND